MTSAGRLLRSEREHQQLQIAQVAQDLKITQSYLTAIEEDRLAELPGVFFYKSFARQYATYLGIERESVESGLAFVCNAASEPSSKNSDVKSLTAAEVLTSVETQSANLARSTEFLQRSAEFFREAGERLFAPSRTEQSFSGGLATILILGCAGFAGWSEWPKISAAAHAGAKTISSQEAASVAVPLQAEVASITETVVESSEANHAVTESAAVASSIQAVQPENSRSTTPASLKLTALEPTWFAVSNQGKLIYAGVLQAGESKLFEDLREGTLRLGNAGGIQAEWNGQPTGSLGHHGDVRTVQLTPDGVKILAPGGQL
jgi:cytoskeleton protein RodZ